ncbi:MAG: NAD(P)-dependent alcohol dehydrogenase [Actinomycetota bacterium]
MATTHGTTTADSAAAGTTPADVVAPDTMRAAVRYRYGGPDVVTSETVPTPMPGPGEILIKVHAAGLDRGTWHMLTGLPLIARPAFGLRQPKQPVLGLAVAGTVVGAGNGATEFTIGDEVMGIADGSFAEYAVASVDKVVLRPAAVDPIDAAASTVSGITAVQALTTVGRVEPGQRVLVLGASGGVGTFAVQLAAAHGANVTGVASAAKLDAVRNLGAEAVVDYRTDDLADHAGRYDLVLDIGGRRSVRALRRLLNPAGTLVIVGGEGAGRVTGGIGRQLRAAALSPFVSQRLVFFVSKESRTYIEPLVDHLAAGTVAPPGRRPRRPRRGPGRDSADDRRGHRGQDGRRRRRCATSSRSFVERVDKPLSGSATAQLNDVEVGVTCDRRLQPGTAVAVVVPDPTVELERKPLRTPIGLHVAAIVPQRSAQRADQAPSARRREHHDGVGAGEPNIEGAPIVAVDDPALCSDEIALCVRPLLARRGVPPRPPEVPIEVDHLAPEPLAERTGEGRLSGAAGPDDGDALQCSPDTKR